MQSAKMAPGAEKPVLTAEEKSAKTAKSSTRYPFWFGGSASSMAACVTHPLDLGPPASPPARCPQKHVRHRPPHPQVRRPRRPLRRPLGLTAAPDDLLDRPLRRLRGAQNARHAPLAQQQAALVPRPHGHGLPRRLHRRRLRQRRRRPQRAHAARRRPAARRAPQLPPRPRRPAAHGPRRGAPELVPRRPAQQHARRRHDRLAARQLRHLQGPAAAQHAPPGRPDHPLHRLAARRHDGRHRHEPRRRHQDARHDRHDPGGPRQDPQNHLPQRGARLDVQGLAAQLSAPRTTNNLHLCLLGDAPQAI